MDMGLFLLFILLSLQGTHAAPCTGSLQTTVFVAVKNTPAVCEWWFCLSGGHRYRFPPSNSPPFQGCVRYSDAMGYFSHCMRRWFGGRAPGALHPLSPQPYRFRLGALSTHQRLMLAFLPAATCRSDKRLLRCRRRTSNKRALSRHSPTGDGGSHPHGARIRLHSKRYSTCRGGCGGASPPAKAAAAV